MTESDRLRKRHQIQLLLCRIEAHHFTIGSLFEAFDAHGGASIVSPESRQLMEELVNCGERYKAELERLERELRREEAA